MLMFDGGSDVCWYDLQHVMVIKVVGVVFFFFEQKAAYEVRISDWSSDVCSADLVRSADASSAANSWSTAARCRPACARTRSSPPGAKAGRRHGSSSPGWPPASWPSAPIRPGYRSSWAAADAGSRWSAPWLALPPRCSDAPTRPGTEEDGGRNS